ncbi:MAG TPA: SHOCT domain-containing protein [Sulfurimonas sp.]|uniref:SHOCT domain-containing protein n=1 Tax=Sulfurimonas sp. TaxID=2022749 RepID=UPI002BB4257A|nr:SHOCT domain-containing protein [Sulfurimonas sp.]HUH42341.1 SHOCT domain-containing protein [Sulfurimonas sp.]
MTKREQNVEAGRKFGEAINAAGIIERFFGYAILWVILFTISHWIAYLSFNPSDFHVVVRRLVGLATIFLPALPFYFWERNIRKFRRANGLSIYKNVKAELEQMELNERIAKEHKAFVANGLVKESADKKDIDYWFGLLQKGAITQEEYEVKKRELI